MLVNGHLHALGEHVEADGGDGAGHVLGIEIIIGAKIVLFEPVEGHGG